MIPKPLQVLISLRVEMMTGTGLSPAIKKTCSGDGHLYCRSLLNWLARIEAGQESGTFENSLPELTSTPVRRGFLKALGRGLKGAPVAEALVEIESEFFSAAENAYERQLQLLPMKLLVPLTLFVLPSILTLIAGPLLFNLKGGFSP
jgi:hypothetical protein